MTRIAVRAPDHLGDAVMALPSLGALAKLGPLMVHTRGRWASELYADFALAAGDAPPEADLGVMLKPSWHAAWAWRGRTTTVGVGPPGIYHRALPAKVEHRRARYARIAGSAGAEVEGEPMYAHRGVAPAGLPAAYLALNPWSPSATVRWRGFAALAAAAPLPVVAFCGPGEEPLVRAALPGVQLVAGLSLPDFAAALQGATAFVSNDSGAAHFAAACGVPVVMVHGSTAPESTGVGRPVEREVRLWCQPCYRKHCFWGTPCLDVEVAQVLAAVESGARQG